MTTAAALMTDTAVTATGLGGTLMTTAALTTAARAGEAELTAARGDGVVDIRDATLRFGRSLVAADGGLVRQMVHHCVEDRPRRQRNTRVGSSPGFPAAHRLGEAGCAQGDRDTG